jgi:hypothetical protein
VLVLGVVCAAIHFSAAGVLWFIKSAIAETELKYDIPDECKFANKSAHRWCHLRSFVCIAYWFIVMGLVPVVGSKVLDVFLQYTDNMAPVSEEKPAQNSSKKKGKKGSKSKKDYL